MVLFLTKGLVVEKRVEAEKLHTSCWIFLGKHFITVKTCVFSRGQNSKGQFQDDKSLSVSSRTYGGFTGIDRYLFLSGEKETTAIIDA